MVGLGDGERFGRRPATVNRNIAKLKRIVGGANRDDHRRVGHAGKLEHAAAVILGGILRNARIACAQPAVAIYVASARSLQQPPPAIAAVGAVVEVVLLSGRAGFNGVVGELVSVKVFYFEGAAAAAGKDFCQRVAHGSQLPRLRQASRHSGLLHKVVARALVGNHLVVASPGKADVVVKFIFVGGGNHGEAAFRTGWRNAAALRDEAHRRTFAVAFPAVNIAGRGIFVEGLAGCARQVELVELGVLIVWNELVSLCGGWGGKEAVFIYGGGVAGKGSAGAVVGHFVSFFAHQLVLAGVFAGRQLPPRALAVEVERGRHNEGLQRTLVVEVHLPAAPVALLKLDVVPVLVLPVAHLQGSSRDILMENTYGEGGVGLRVWQGNPVAAAAKTYRG